MRHTRLMIIFFEKTVGCKVTKTNTIDEGKNDLRPGYTVLKKYRILTLGNSYISSASNAKKRTKKKKEVFQQNSTLAKI